MGSAPVDVGLSLLAWLLGSLPVAHVVTRRLSGRDIRQSGSGNVGTVNALRTGGISAGLLTILADAGKGALAVWLAMRFGNWPALPWLALTLVVLGHNYMVFLRFRGGKGLAAGAGGLLVLSPAALGWVLLILLGLVPVLRDTNVAAAGAVLALPIVLLFQEVETSALLFAVLLVALIESRHRSDLIAYRQGRRHII